MTISACDPPTTARIGNLLSGKESALNAGDTGDVVSIPGLRRSSGGGNDNPLQYSHLRNPIDRGAWWATVHEITEPDTTE